MKILIATDGSPSALEAVEFGLDLAQEQGAWPVFIHVAPSHRARAPLVEALRRAAEKNVPARTEHVRGNPAEAIVGYARTIKAELIVVGSRGHGTAASVLLGSVSRGVLHRARCPVVVVRGTPGALRGGRKSGHEAGSLDAHRPVVPRASNQRRA